MDRSSSTDTLGANSPFNRSAQHDAKRSAILSQAARLFNSKGSQATTLQDISATLGLTKTSLYYYVKTKEELIYQCYMATLGYHLERMDEIEVQHAAPLERARAFFLQQFEAWLAARQNRGPHLAAPLEIASLPDARRREVEARYISIFTRLRGYLRDGIGDGSVRQCETTAATRAIIGSLDWIFSWLHHQPQSKVGDIALAAWDIVECGFYNGGGEYLPAALRPESPVEGYTHGFDRDAQNRLKQQAFYKAGTWFFNKQGFNGTSLDEIAEHLNVSKGAFYYHIKNKEDLLFNCYVYSLDIMDSIYERAAGLKGSALHQLDQIVRQVFFVQNSDQGPLIRYNTITALPIPRRKLILARTDESNQHFGDIIRAGIADDSIRPIQPDIAQHLIAGALNAAMDIKLWRRVDDLDTTAIDYFDVFFNGLRPRPHR